MTYIRKKDYNKQLLGIEENLKFVDSWVRDNQKVQEAKKMNRKKTPLKYKTWTKQEEVFLEENYGKVSVLELARKLERSLSSVSSKLKRLKAEKRQGISAYKERFKKVNFPQRKRAKNNSQPVQLHIDFSKPAELKKVEPAEKTKQVIQKTIKSELPVWIYLILAGVFLTTVFSLLSLIMIIFK